jgi:cytoskeletal protein RodZ
VSDEAVDAIVEIAIRALPAMDNEELACLLGAVFCVFVREAAEQRAR